MHYRICGLSPEPFRHLFGLDDAALAQQSIRRYAVDEAPGFPCRVGLEDLPVGASALLLNYEHQPAESPYRARGPIFVREGAADVAVFEDRVPEVMARRVLSVRPGITSLASVTYRDEEAILVGDDWERVYIDEVMPAKLAIDRAYVVRQSLWLDLKILAATVLAPLRLERLVNLDGALTALRDGTDTARKAVPA